MVKNSAIEQGIIFTKKRTVREIALLKNSVARLKTQNIARANIVVS